MELDIHVFLQSILKHRHNIIDAGGVHYVGFPHYRTMMHERNSVYMTPRSLVRTSPGGLNKAAQLDLRAATLSRIYKIESGKQWKVAKH